jgi:molybdopterin-binding protein
LESVAQLAGFENILEATFIAEHPEQGTMTCRVDESALSLEVPLTRVDRSGPLRIGIRAGDILLAASSPQGLSARNIFSGTITNLERRDVMVIANVDCGVQIEVHLTPAASADLNLAVGRRVWLVVKTYSCQVLQNRG